MNIQAVTFFAISSLGVIGLAIHGLVPLLAEPDVVGDVAGGKEALHHLCARVAAQGPLVGLVAVGHHEPLVRHLPRHLVKAAHVVGDLLQGDARPPFAHLGGYQCVRVAVQTVALAYLAPNFWRATLAKPAPCFPSGLLPNTKMMSLPGVMFPL